jgi:glycosyltransferase involved in cell wall biosynthesis
MKNCLIIYRGPLQRSRLSLILSTYSEAFQRLDFLWLVPHPKYHNENVFNDFISQFRLNQIHVIDGRLKKYFSATSEIKKKKNDLLYDRLVLIGTTSIFFLPLHSTVDRDYFINGIPEERFFHKSSFKNKIQVFFIWKMISFYSVDRVFSVSKYMSEYLKTKIKAKSYHSIPSGIYHNEAMKNLTLGSRMVYSGSGAPWQWLSQLSSLWQEIHQQDSNIKFLVVSRDPRTKILISGLNPDSIKFVQGINGEEVFSCLQEGSLGFLLRQDHLVNRVSFPIKFGEYLAAGLKVVVSDFEWECADFIRNNGGGLLVINDNLKNEAGRIIQFFKSLNFDDKVESHQLSRGLSRDISKKKLMKILIDNNYDSIE